MGWSGEQEEEERRGKEERRLTNRPHMSRGSRGLDIEAFAEVG